MIYTGVDSHNSVRVSSPFVFASDEGIPDAPRSAVDLRAERYALGLDLWTGKPLVTPTKLDAPRESDQPALAAVA